MTNHFPWEFIGAVIGGGISGLVGILVTWYSFKKRNTKDIRENTYIPLYDSIMSLNLEPEFYAYTESEWSRLETHKKLLVDDKIKNLYTKYETLSNKHHHLFAEWRNEYDKKRDHFVSLIKPIFDSMGVSKEGKLPIKPSYLVDIESFQNWFCDVLFDKTIKDSEELYQKLMSYSRKQYTDFPDFFKHVHDEKPEFYNELLNKLKEINTTFPENIDYAKLVEIRNELKPLIIEIRAKLRKKIS